ncbi:MAG: TPR repeat protein/SH3-like domain-containing protein [Gammaproteobacteria bacterium]|jgi:TPR repeat protein/SH3-like domain-containing protein
MIRAKNLFYLCFLFIAIGSLPDISAAGAREDARRAYEEKDYDKAHELWEQLSNQGDKEAQFSIGVMYSLGTGKEKDPAKAFQWFSQAGQNGHLKAMFNLGIAYWTGHGTLEDKKEAVHWWRKAAEKGDPASQFNLGIAYYNGFGVEKDLVLATRWIRSAAENQYASAQEILPALEERLRSTQSTVAATVTDPEANSEEETPVVSSTKQLETNSQSKAEQPATNNTAKRKTTELVANAQPVKKAEPEPAAEPKYLDVDFTAGIIKVDSSEVYATNNPKSPVIEKLGSGTPVRIEKQKSGWSEVRMPGGFRVWVYGTYVSGEGKNATINGAGVRARPLPSTAEESVVVGAFKKDDKVELLKTEGKWKQVRSPEHLTAWIKSKQITKLKKPTQAWMDRWTELGR